MRKVSIKRSRKVKLFGVRCSFEKKRNKESLNSETLNKSFFSPFTTQKTHENTTTTNFRALLVAFPNPPSSFRLPKSEEEKKEELWWE